MEKWIQKAVKKPGSLRKSMGVKSGEKIPAKKLSAAAKKPGKLGKRARLAETLKSFSKGKRMAAGGPVGYGGTQTNDPVGRGGVGGTGLGGVSGGIRGGGSGRGGPAGGVTTGTTTGTSATNRTPSTARPMARPSAPPIARLPNRPASLAQPPLRPPTMTYEDMGAMFKRPESGTNWPGQGRGMRGGGLARKGVGQALSHGGKVKPSKKR